VKERKRYGERGREKERQSEESNKTLAYLSMYK
jgi:hypothetical protein